LLVVTLGISLSIAGYPLHSPFSPKLPYTCASMCHHATNELYKQTRYFCPICPTVFQSTTHHHSLTSTNHAVSLVPSVPLSFSHPQPLFTIQCKTCSFSCPIPCQLPCIQIEYFPQP
jgi:hypothetical protein